MKTVKPIFKDPLYQLSFEKNGFVKVPLLNEKKVNELFELFNITRKQHETVANLHHTTTDTQNADLIYLVDKKIYHVT